MKKKFLFFLLAAALLLSTLLSGCAKRDEGSGEVEITAFSIGCADSLLIQCGEHTMLIDTGESDDAGTLLSALAEKDITKLDVLLITHFDRDHVGSAARIVREMTVDRVLYPDYEGTRGEYFAFIAAIHDHPDAEAVDDITDLTLGSAALTVYPAVDSFGMQDGEDEFDNDMSLVVKMTLGERSFLFCGDVEKQRLKEMMAQDTDWQCDWIKMPHHGAYYKLLKSFLKQNTPSYAVITDSGEEPADGKTLELLDSLSVETFRTSYGTVVTHCDGRDITVEIE